MSSNATPPRVRLVAGRRRPRCRRSTWTGSRMICASRRLCGTMTRWSRAGKRLPDRSRRHPSPQSVIVRGCTAMPEPSASYEPLPNTPSDNQPPPASTSSRLRAIGRALLFGATAALVVLAILRANQWTNRLGELQAPPAHDTDAEVPPPAQDIDNKNTTAPDMPEHGKYSVG